jgi:hypothetical protein
VVTFVVFLSKLEKRKLEEVVCLKYTLIGKATPLQAWTGSECSRSVRFPEFKAINTRSQAYAPATFTSQEIFLVLNT